MNYQIMFPGNIIVSHFIMRHLDSISQFYSYHNMIDNNVSCIMIKYKNIMNSYIFIQNTINGYPRKGMFFNNPIKNFFFGLTNKMRKQKPWPLQIENGVCQIQQIVFGPFVRAYFLWFKEYLTHKTFAKAYEPFQLYCFDPLF